jgi:Leucine-rich repeat (LRR) protein
MTSLVKLQLGNNIIGKIGGLESLVNLKELDLSFNNIEIIENLGALVKLEVLTLFENQISKLENLETLVNLLIFSIGNNRIEDRNDVSKEQSFYKNIEQNRIYKNYYLLRCDTVYQYIASFQRNVLPPSSK